jgi:dienelactone hydrolase
MHEKFLTVQRTARYYTAGVDAASARDVWFVLHGYGQLAADFLPAFERLPDEKSRCVIAPEALNRFYLVAPVDANATHRPVGATWMTRVDREHDIEDYVAYLDTLYARVVEDRKPFVRVLGFSQGVATAARWVALGRARVDQLICWGGTLPSEIDLPHLSQRLSAPLHFVVGDKDHFATPDVIAKEEARLRGAKIRYELTRFPGGHALHRAVLSDLVALPVP